MGGGAVVTTLDSMVSSLAVVLPVRNGADLLDDCLDGVTAEAAVHGAEVIVVDDASADDTAARARAHHVTVVQHAAPAGPYVARNTGWRHGEATTIVFVDVRCRVRTGWLQALLDALRDDVAVAGGGYHVLPGRSLAARSMHRQQPFRAAVSLGDLMPFLPGGNLLVRRSVLETLGGFDPDLRSGGDLVLCWRAVAEGLGRVVEAPGAEVDWVPREDLRSFVRQRARYGAARPRILARLAEHGVVPAPPGRLPELRAVQAFWRQAVDARGRDLLGLALEEWSHARYHRAYRTAWRQLHDAETSHAPREPRDEG